MLEMLLLRKCFCAMIVQLLVQSLIVRCWSVEHGYKCWVVCATHCCLFHECFCAMIVQLLVQSLIVRCWSVEHGYKCWVVCATHCCLFHERWCSAGAVFESCWCSAGADPRLSSPVLQFTNSHLAVEITTRPVMPFRTR